MTTIHQEGAHHFAHPLTNAGLMLPLIPIRLALWDDTASGIWGFPCTVDVEQRADDIADAFRNRAPGQRFVHIIWALNRSTNRRMQKQFGPPSTATVLKGLRTGTFPCSGDIALLGPLAQAMIDRGIDLDGAWMNSEIRPEKGQDNLPPEMSTPAQFEHHDDYADVIDAMKVSDTELDRRSMQALYNAGRTVLLACGLNPNAAIVNACAGVQTGWAHNDAAHPAISCTRSHLIASYPGEQTTQRLDNNLSQLSAAARKRAVVHFDATGTPPDDMLARVKIMRKHKVTDGILFCDNALTPDQLAPFITALRPALEAAK